MDLSYPYMLGRPAREEYEARMREQHLARTPSPVTAPQLVPEAEPNSPKHVLVLSLSDYQERKSDVWVEFFEHLSKRCWFTRATTVSQALHMLRNRPNRYQSSQASKLNSTSGSEVPPINTVLIVEPTIFHLCRENKDARLLADTLPEFTRTGGTTICALSCTSFNNCEDIDSFWSEVWGLPWQAGSVCRGSLVPNPKRLLDVSLSGQICLNPHRPMNMNGTRRWGEAQKRSRSKGQSRSVEPTQSTNNSMDVDEDAGMDIDDDDDDDDDTVSDKDDSDYDAEYDAEYDADDDDDDGGEDQPGKVETVIKSIEHDDSYYVSKVRVVSEGFEHALLRAMVASHLKHVAIEHLIYQMRFVLWDENNMLDPELYGLYPSSDPSDDGEDGGVDIDADTDVDADDDDSDAGTRGCYKEVWVDSSGIRRATNRGMQKLKSKRTIHEGPVVLAPYGQGLVGWVGDTGTSEDTYSLIFSMCGLEG